MTIESQDLIDYLPTITREGMIEVDRIMVQDLKIPVSLMMEQAGLNLARLSMKYSKSHDCDRFLVICGDGNNGGGGLVAARRLFSWGVNVSVCLPKGLPTRKIPLTQYERIKGFGIDINTDLDVIADPGTLVIDSFIGYNYHQREDPVADTVFDFLRESKVIALDIGSGIDSTTGQNVSGLSPIATLTLAWPKRGFRFLQKDAFGDLYLTDIGIPSSIYLRENILDNAILSGQLEELNLRFSNDSIIPIEIGEYGWKLE